MTDDLDRKIAAWLETAPCPMLYDGWRREDAIELGAFVRELIQQARREALEEAARTVRELLTPPDAQHDMNRADLLDQARRREEYGDAVLDALKAIRALLADQPEARRTTYSICSQCGDIHEPASGTQGEK
jgi:RNA polymerase-binding transcription factor DksA